ncbi:3-hydroxyisobutyryl-CoA hydrolase [Glutamicibacter uratoxydans]|uniref:3-hydroxyisobutyryl-CoA hydrolase n=1 Tax=Glutamicibacter uratoxydans TaxID=43667 RepID=UPI003D6E196D
MSDLLAERRGDLGLLTLNRPESLNALTTSMCQAMLDTLLRWRDDPRIKQVVVTGAGERGLCAGGDIVAIYRDIKNRTGATEEFWRIEYQLNALISEYPKPYIALMDGIVLGGGIGISAHGSHRIVTERSKCGMPEVGIGFFPDVGGTYLLARAPRPAGRYAALTGASFGAADAITLGLADVHVSSHRLAELLRKLETEPVDAMLHKFASIPAPGSLAQQWVQSFAAKDLAQIRNHLAESNDPGSAQALQRLARACPSSVDLVNTLCELAGSDLRQDLKREFRAAVHRLDDPDFAEGIRAQVIDKDRTPRWSITREGFSAQQRISAHLAPLPTAELDFQLINKSPSRNKE